MSIGLESVPVLAEEYAREVRARLGACVQKVILFGSHARGEGTDASDFDFVVIVDGIVTRALRDVVNSIGADVLDRENRLCAALVYDEQQWERVKESPLGWNIIREGVEL